MISWVRAGRYFSPGYLTDEEGVLDEHNDANAIGTADPRADFLRNSSPEF